MADNIESLLIRGLFNARTVLDSPARRALLVALLCAPVPAHADDNKAEAEIIRGMTYSRTLEKRLKEPGEVIRALVRENVLALKPNRRMDYTDYRIVKRPVSFFGHELIAVEEEYMTKYIGCCVSEGIGVILRVRGDLGRLEAFAKENRCGFRQQDHVIENLKDIGVKDTRGTLTAVSCRERDAVTP